MTNNGDPNAPGASTGASSLIQAEASKSSRKRCKGVTRSGTPCTAWAMEGGLCYFHGNPDKASELGKRGGRAKGSMGTLGAAEYVARRPIKDVADVASLLADTINDLRSGAAISDELGPSWTIGRIWQ